MLWWVPLLPILAAGLVLAAGGHGRAVLGAVGVAVTAATAALAAAAWAGGWQGRLPWAEPIVLEAALGPFSGVMAVLVPAVALPVLLWAAGREERPGLGRLVALLLLFVGAMELLLVARDFVTLLIGWELVGACSWALIAHRWQEGDAPRSAAVAFLVTRFGDLGLFVAAGLVLAGTGGFALDAVGALAGWPLHLAAAGIVLSAVAKSGQLPFSYWLFRAMDGPTSVSALLHAATMVAAGAYLLARLEPQLAVLPWFGPVLIAVGLATALVGGILALLQSHAKRLLAASTSAHFGLMLVAVGAGYPAVALAHLVAHAFFKAALFLAAGTAGHAAGTYRLHRMRLGRGLPVVAVLTAVAALALGGVPPLGGAWTKDAVAAAAGHLSPVLAIAVLVAGGLSAAYAARFVLLAYGRRGRPSERVASLAEPASSAWALGLLVAASLALSALWLPAVRGAAGRLLGAELPQPRSWELLAAVLLVAIGLYGGRVLARRRPAPENDPRVAAVADWAGIPSLVHAVVTVPMLWAARTLSAFDDRVLDAPPRLAGRFGAPAARRLGRFDDVVVDAPPRAAGRFGERTVRAAARLAELVVDGLAEGAARLLGSGGGDLRRAQSGMSHHYYALIVGTVLVIVAALALGS